MSYCEETSLDVRAFPAGIYIDGFIDSVSCQAIRSELLEAEWVAAQVGRYSAGEFQGAVVDRSISTALVSKGFHSRTVEEGQILRRYERLAKSHLLLDLTFRQYGFSKYPSGSRLGVHRDTGAVETNRVLTSVLFLNSGFTGGVLQFPQWNAEVSPEPGALVMFYSEVEHSVTEVELADRYVMVSFGETDRA